VLGYGLTDSLQQYADSISAPKGYAYSIFEPNTIRWTWTDSGGGAIIGFRIYYGVVGTSSWSGYYQIANPSTRSVSYEQALPRGTWRVAVAAYNSTGEVFSAEQIATNIYAIDSISVSTEGRVLIDAKPIHADSISVAHHLEGNLSDTNADYSDSIDHRVKIEIGLSDALGEPGEILSTGFKFIEPLSVYADSMQVGFAFGHTDSMDFGDGIDVELNSYEDITLEYGLIEDGNIPQDGIVSDIYSSEEIKVNFSDSLEYAVDEFASFMSMDAVLPVDANEAYADASTWGETFRIIAFTDSIPSREDVLTVVLGLPTIDYPGTGYDVAWSPWQNLNDENEWEPVEYPDTHR